MCSSPPPFVDRRENFAQSWRAGPQHGYCASASEWARLRPTPVERQAGGVKSGEVRQWGGEALASVRPRGPLTPHLSQFAPSGLQAHRVQGPGRSARSACESAAACTKCQRDGRAARRGQMTRVKASGPPDNPPARPTNRSEPTGGSIRPPGGSCPTAMGRRRFVMAVESCPKVARQAFPKVTVAPASTAIAPQFPKRCSMRRSSAQSGAKLSDWATI